MASIIRSFFRYAKGRECLPKNIQKISVKNTIAKAAFSWKVPAFAPVAA